MSDTIRRLAMQSLTHFDVCCSGRHAEIGFMDHGGRPATLYVPHDCLSRLLMTLPTIIEEAIRHRTGDPTLRNVYPLGDWQLHRAAGSGSMVLTLATPDGFGVSFDMPAPDAARLADALRSGSGGDGQRRPVGRSPLRH
jgi:hypothetical protein